MDKSQIGSAQGRVWLMKNKTEIIWEVNRLFNCYIPQHAIQWKEPGILAVHKALSLSDLV